MYRKLNVKLLAGLLVGVVVVAGVVHLVHRSQGRRNAGSLLQQAERAEADGKSEEAASILSRYLTLVPSDTEVLARYGLLLDRTATVPNARQRAFLILEQVLRRAPRRDDVRRRLIQIAMHPQLQRFSDASTHLDTLLAKFPNGDAELELWRAQCHEGSGEFPKAAEWYEKTIAHAPAQLDAYRSLSDVLRRRLDNPKKAEVVLERMVAANPQNARAWLVRANDRLERGQTEQAAEDLARAVTLGPDDADILLAQGKLMLARGELEQARKPVEQGLRLHPEIAAFYLTLAEVDTRARRSVEAVACLRRGLEKAAQPHELLWMLANLRVEQGEEPTDEMARLKELGISGAHLDFLRGRVLASQKKWLDASRLFERIQTDLSRWPVLARQANLLLAECYGELGNVDQQHVVYRRAVTADPLSVPACLGLAQSQAMLGKVDDALETYRRLLPRVPSVRVQVARLMLTKNLRLPASRRNWDEIEEILDEAAKASPDLIDVPLLQAEVLASQQKFAPAQALIVAARDAQPKRLEPWLALAALAEWQDQADEMMATLNTAAEMLGDRVEIRLARAEWQIRHGGAEASPAIVKLGAGTDSFSAAQRRQLLQGLASAQLRAGNSAEADRLWLGLSRQEPANLNFKLQRLDLALRSSNEAVMRQLIDEFKVIEGDDGAFTRYGQACYLLWQADKNKPDALVQARTLVAKLAEQRPTWGRVALAQAKISDRQRDVPGAIKSFQRAVELGEVNSLALRRMVELLYQQGRYAEAEEAIRNLPGEESASPQYQRVAAELSLRRDDPAGALKLARQAVSVQSKNFRDWLWLGQILNAAGQPTDAEKALYRAVDLAGNEPDAWMALVLHHVRTGAKNKAEEALREAQAKLTNDQAPLALAACHEALGQREQAAKLYQQALAARPDDPATLRALIAFSMQQAAGNAEVEKLLKKLMSLEAKAPEDAAWARRTLAVVLASRGDEPQRRDALALLSNRDEKAAAKSTPLPSLEEGRARAVVLASQKSRKQRQQAIVLLEGLDRQQHLAGEDLFLLAQLYEAMGDWTKARERLLQLVADDKPQLRYLAHYAQALLRRGDLDDAELWLRKLQGLPSAQGTFAVVDLQARLQAAHARPKDALEVIEQYQQNDRAVPKDPGVRRSLTAALLDELCTKYPNEKAYAAQAEKRYREADANQQERAVDLALFLGRRGRIGEALDSCENGWRTMAPDAVSTACLAILHCNGAGAEHYRRVEQRLEAALAKASTPSLLVCLADLRDLQGRHDEAGTLYRKALERDPKNVVALNNLAYLLALKENKGSEALELLGRAIAVAGPVPELLDTRALVYLTMGRSEQAIQELEEALGEAPLSSLCFHLAQAHKVAKNPEAARAAFLRAKSLGLQVNQLHALERSVFQQLHAELDSR